jgi:RsiW-degrading membrane proteinase PrsW (M82 family)
MFGAGQEYIFHGFYPTKKFDNILYMYGTLVLLGLIFISSIPVIAVYVWFRLAKYQVFLFQFLFALFAGTAAFFPALFLQNHLVPIAPSGRFALFYDYFVRIAFTEELSRLLMLFVFFFVSGRITKVEDTAQPLSYNVVKKGTAIGLIAGLGFAILENSRFAAADTSVLLFRIITAAVHGACGSRVGAAAVMFRKSPIQAIFRLLTATAIHGIYNLMVLRPGVSSIAAVLIAISALISSILTIRGGWSAGEKSPANP